MIKLPLLVFGSATCKVIIFLNFSKHFFICDICGVEDNPLKHFTIILVSEYTLKKINIFYI